MHKRWQQFNPLRLLLQAVLILTALPQLAMAQAVQVPPAEVCFQATTGITGMIATLGTVTGGTGGTAGTYTNVSLTGGSGSGATANITVAGGAVTQVVIFYPGTQYAVADVLSAAAANIGGVTGFSVPVASVTINSAVAGGSVGMYVPGTLTYSNTWKNAAQSILNPNPIPLDANGCAIIYGVGTYRQILYDSLGNQVWDRPTTVAQVGTYWAGTAGGTANAITFSWPSFASQNGQTVDFMVALNNTGAVTINSLPLLKNTLSGPAALTGNELIATNFAEAVYNASLNSFILANPQFVVGCPPVSASLTSGSSATYTTPTCSGVLPTSLEVTLIGGGGGGGGCGSAAAGNGGAGSATSFGSFTANGGAGGIATNNGSGGEGNVGGSGGLGIAFLRITGAPGSAGAANYGAGGIGSPASLSGIGGTSPLGGAGAPSTAHNAAIQNGIANTGSGAAGGLSGAQSIGSGGGGGAGEYAQILITNPAASYTYTVGSGGTAGGAGTSGTAGGVGASGIIIIKAKW